MKKWLFLPLLVMSSMTIQLQFALGSEDATHVSYNAVVHIHPEAKLKVLKNFDFHQDNPNVTKAVVIIHGSHRHPKKAFLEMMKVFNESYPAQSTVILAPDFMDQVDDPQH
jgi:hypothetical protein